MKKFLILLLVFTCAGVWAQDFGFGFGDDSEAVSSSASSAKVKVSGDITVELSPFVHDFGKEEGAQEISFWDMVSGTLNFSASGSNIEAFASFNLNADAIRELGDANPMLDDPTYTPLIMNEAYLKAYIGAVNIEAGLRKLTWGKADSPGPLDVTNPMDYTDLRYITDTLACKIARPMIHVTWNAGAFSKLEGVFIPNFAGHRFAMDGRWRPSQYDSIRSNAEAGISSIADEKLKLMASDPAFIPIYMANHNIMNEVLIGVGGGLAYLGEDPSFPSTGAFENFQAGLHYTTTIGSADIGAQYFYGNLFRPNFTIAGIDAYLEDLAKNILSGADPIKYDNTSMISPQLKYTRYHQIGVDYAQVLFGFNVRAEAAFNLTEDFSGDDGSVQNPFIGWSLGFDRDLFLGVNLNLQCNETVRLFNDKIGDNPILDAEADTKAVSTRLTMKLSRKFFRDNLESSATAIWDIENADCYIIPALVWSEGDMSCKLSAGVFAGKETGELGQYWRNNYIKFGVTYSF